jgi:5-methylcytosine-specific restriction protein A
VRNRVRRRDKWKCVLCGKPGTDVDHIVELVDGGSWGDMSNLRLLCNPCHKRKTAESRKIRAAKKKQEKLNEQADPKL